MVRFVHLLISSLTKSTCKNKTADENILTETTERIDLPHALRYFSRLRFTYNLLPLLKASPSPRVISILGGGLEKEIDTDDIEVRKDFTAMKGAQAGTTRTFPSLFKF